MKDGGYVLIDHRASPGFTEEQAQQLHLPYEQVKEGKMLETSSLTCAHCKSAVIKNPLRTRERAHCFKCNHYICDICEYKSKQPGYIHRTAYEEALEAAKLQNKGIII